MNHHMKRAIHVVHGCILLCVSVGGGLVCAQSTMPPVMTYEYDAEGNLTKSVVDELGLGLSDSHHYNLLGQRDWSLDPKNGKTKFEYDNLGRLTKVTDPLGLVTSYALTSLGDFNGLSSPDTGGHQVFEVNSAGQPKFWVDARGVNTTVTYDAKNRVTNMLHTMGRPSENYTWTYDQTGATYGKGVGHLTSTSTSDGATVNYKYDNKGRVVGQTQTTSGTVTTFSSGVSYGYDGADRLIYVVYPSGRMVKYQNLISGVATMPQQVYLYPSSQSLQAPTTETVLTVMSSVMWRPFGAATSWRWGDASGQKYHGRLFDIAGRMTQYPLGLHTRSISYDSAGRISGYKHYLSSTNAATPTVDQSFNYDKNGQLTDINLYAAAWHIDYDANGNRTSVTIGTNTRAYGTEMVAGTTTPKSNRLKTLSNPAVSLTHLATGQTLSDDGRASYTHYLNGRIKTITLPGGTKSVVFTYDADGRRMRKYTQNLVSGSWVVDQASVVHYVYDLAGHVLGEYNVSGAPLREYIWVGDMPVALFTPGATASAAPVLYYIHTDHLNTPRAVVDTAGNLRWRWIADPFGTAVPETNPAGLGAFVQNLRFPGQVADGETGLFYNVARFYDPMIGRYVESDPIGLAGGVNTYAYAGGNPVGNTDPLGLATQAEINAALQTLTTNYPNDFSKPPTSVTSFPMGENGLGMTDWSNNIKLNANRFGSSSECVKSGDEYQFLQTLAHEMLHVNESIPRRLLSNGFRMGNPLGYFHRQLDDKADEMTTQKIIDKYIKVRNSNKDCTCR